MGLLPQPATIVNRLCRKVKRARVEVAVVKLPKPTEGTFPTTMAYARWGNGPKTLLVIPGGPGNDPPTGRRVRMMGRSLRPLVENGYTLWMVARPRGTPERFLRGRCGRLGLPAIGSAAADLDAFDKHASSEGAHIAGHMALSCWMCGRPQWRYRPTGGRLGGREGLIGCVRGCGEGVSTGIGLSGGIDKGLVQCHGSSLRQGIGPPVSEIGLGVVNR